jgi:hypothetical protein
MITMPRHAQPELSAASLLGKPTGEAAAGRSAEVKNDQLRRPAGHR